jgi:SAM-dependent methyltransferase
MAVRLDTALLARARRTATLTCVVCGVAEMEPLADLGTVPVFSGVTFMGREEALASPSARMQLVACPACCHVYNATFDPSLVTYDSDYDNSLHHSRTFQEYAHHLAVRLAREYSLQDAQVVELGCGKGHFLVDLCRAAGCRGTGYDPSYEADVADERVSFVRDYMSWDDPEEFDFFVSRHVVEHLADPLEFLSGLRRACGTRRVCGYIEVPDAIYDFERSPWNCHYPHVSYFSATGLARLAIRAGFGVLRLARSFEGQYLALELGVNTATPDQVSFGGMGLHREREILRWFGANYTDTVRGWRERLSEVGYERCALWGAGAKGLGFVNAVDRENRLGAVVDLNPHKHGRYLPVTAHRIISPEELASKEVAAVVITNPVYRREVETALSQLGIDAPVVSAH